MGDGPERFETAFEGMGAVWIVPKVSLPKKISGCGESAKLKDIEKNYGRLEINSQHITGLSQISLYLSAWSSASDGSINYDFLYWIIDNGLNGVTCLAID